MDGLSSLHGFRMTTGQQSSSKVKFDRRRAAMDSDDDDLDDL